MSTETPRNIILKPSDKAVAGFMLAAMALAVAALGWGVYTLLPFLIEAAKNTIVLGVEVFVLLGFAMVAMQLWMARDAFVYKFKMNAQSMRRKIAADNPIGTIDAAIDTFETRLEQIDQERVNSDAALLRLKNKIKNREKTGALDRATIEDELATAAERMQKPEAEIAEHATAAERWRDTATKIQPMIDDQEFIKSQLTKARDVAGHALADLKNQREVLALKFEAYKESQTQAKAFRRFFGKSTELEMIDFAVEEIEKQTTNAQSDIDRLMHELTPRVQAAQLAHEAEVQAAMRKRAEKQLAEAKPPQLPPGAAVKEGVIVK